MSASVCVNDREIERACIHYDRNPFDSGCSFSTRPHRIAVKARAVILHGWTTWVHQNTGKMTQNGGEDNEILVMINVHLFRLIFRKKKVVQVKINKINTNAGISIWINAGLQNFGILNTNSASFLIDASRDVPKVLWLAANAIANANAIAVVGLGLRRWAA